MRVNQMHPSKLWENRAVKYACKYLTDERKDITNIGLTKAFENCIIMPPEKLYPLIRQKIIELKGDD